MIQIVCPSLCARTIGADSPLLQRAGLASLRLRLVSCRPLRRSLRHPLALPIALDTSYSALWHPNLVSQLDSFIVVVARFTGHLRSRLVRPCRCPARSVRFCTHFLRSRVARCRASSFRPGVVQLNLSGGKGFCSARGTALCEATRFSSGVQGFPEGLSMYILQYL